MIFHSPRAPAGRHFISLKMPALSAAQDGNLKENLSHTPGIIFRHNEKTSFRFMISLSRRSPVRDARHDLPAKNHLAPHE